MTTENRLSGSQHIIGEKYFKSLSEDEKGILNAHARIVHEWDNSDNVLDEAVRHAVAIRDGQQTLQNIFDSTQATLS